MWSSRVPRVAFKPNEFVIPSLGEESVALAALKKADSSRTLHVRSE